MTLICFTEESEHPLEMQTDQFTDELSEICFKIIQKGGRCGEIKINQHWPDLSKLALGCIGSHCAILSFFECVWKCPWSQRKEKRKNIYSSAPPRPAIMPFFSCWTESLLFAGLLHGMGPWETWGCLPCSWLCPQNLEQCVHRPQLTVVGRGLCGLVSLSWPTVLSARPQLWPRRAVDMSQRQTAHPRRCGWDRGQEAAPQVRQRSGQTSARSG